MVLNFATCEKYCYDNNKNSTTILNRKKRYLVFPKSSTFVVTTTGLKAIQVKEPTNWNLDLEFDMIWPIPTEDNNNKKISKINNIKKKPWKKTFYRLRRQRRDLYANFEMALDKFGVPGRECILRTICEARIFLHQPGVSFIDDLLRVFLSHDENFGHRLDEYDNAYRTINNCDLKYKCPISPLEFLLNYDPAKFL
ncbi:uncharacterized protein LOC122861178 [Aphidius gifuensis]|uniref:uncharacterized protein LOC122861178 n=1 Tax=Aphidius gifuensis TaxID=684658 RepID=UPI001CDCAE33|nr:uncharacterized protein LOC122861178 [Aphidius gifuensis]